MAVLALLLVASSVGVAASGEDLPRWVLSGGATGASGGDVTLRATLGEPVVGGAASSDGQVTLAQGFWQAGAAAPAGYRVYLPVVMRGS
jgi:hypothetical protein